MEGAAIAEEVLAPTLESCWGPRPSLMIALESGISFVCQPLSS